MRRDVAAAIVALILAGAWLATPRSQVVSNPVRVISSSGSDAIGEPVAEPSTYSLIGWLRQIQQAVTGISPGGVAAGTPQSDTVTTSVQGCTRRDSMSAGTGVANGDIGVPSCDSNGAMDVVITTGGTRATLAVDTTHDSPKQTTGPLLMAAAVAHGATPTAVAAGDGVNVIANAHGVPFMIGGHPNITTLEAQIEDADGAQTNAAIVTVGAGTRIIVTMVAMNCDAGNTGPINAVVGFGASSIPSRAHTGTVGIIAAFAGIPAGGHKEKGNGGGIIGIGGDGEDVRITTEDPAGGECSIEVTYYTTTV